jgi:hypothetical protein
MKNLLPLVTIALAGVITSGANPASVTPSKRQEESDFFESDYAVQLPSVCLLFPLI